MVFFTCNHCGESVKKPAVEKHYLTKCRRAPKSVSCMDCLKDFQDNYVEHTKCISEAEKYSGKDYVPKVNTNSGAKKQESWIDVVRSVVASKDLNLKEETRRAFTTLQNYENIPRKKSKFLNFVGNSVRLTKGTAEEVWVILEKELEKMKQARQVEQKSKANETNEAEERNNSDEGVDAKKSKKEKATDGVVEANQNGTGEKGKKRKHPKECELGIEKNSQNDDNDAKNGEINEQNKEKKKKPKNCEESKTIQVNGGTNQVDVESKKKTKKNKAAADESIAAEVPAKKMKKTINGDNENSKKALETKKKNKKIEENGSRVKDEASKKKQKLAQLNNDEQTDAKEPYRFCWNTELTRTILAHPEGIPFETLRKDLMEKFKAKFDEGEWTERQVKNFERKLNKKLHKNAGIQVNGNIVKASS